MSFGSLPFAFRSAAFPATAFFALLISCIVIVAPFFSGQLGGRWAADACLAVQPLEDGLRITSAPVSATTVAPGSPGVTTTVSGGGSTTSSAGLTTTTTACGCPVASVLGTPKYVPIAGVPALPAQFVLADDPTTPIPSTVPCDGASLLLACMASPGGGGDDTRLQVYFTIETPMLQCQDNDNFPVNFEMFTVQCATDGKLLGSFEGPTGPDCGTVFDDYMTPATTKIAASGIMTKAIDGVDCLATGP